MKDAITHTKKSKTGKPMTEHTKKALEEMKRYDSDTLYKMKAQGLK